MAPKGYDFCGWVTKNNIECSDGRTIRNDAFAHQDGARVPLVWMHKHDSPDCVIGYTILENRSPEGVFGYSYCNDTENGKHALEMVKHGDIDCYSIYANRLKENAKDVVHGFIREVSLVLHGANEGARIMDVNLAHSDIFDYDDIRDADPYGAIIMTGDSDMKLSHNDEYSADEEQITVGDILDTLTDEQVRAVLYWHDQTMKDELEAMESEEEYDEDYEDEYEYDEDYEDYESEEEYEEDEETEMAMSHSETEGENDMYSNVFEQGFENDGAYLSHSDMKAIINSAVSSHATSMKEVYNAYCDDLGLSHSDESAGITRSTDKQNYGVNDPSFLFPDYHELNRTPEWIKRNTDWVSVVMNGVKHTPFARIKTQFADITEDEARAKGYIKGNKKVEEVFTLLKRQTDPQTIYKKQKFDRDDIIDIIDFDIIAWIKGEMRIMLNEEIARAILIGD
ncbi:MAG: hypothetical protein MJ238_06480, partial [Bacilli bacterium]|nr:hypothetical protein [Bacilli bacterium]